MAINAASPSQHQSAWGTHATRTDVLVVCSDDRLLIELGPLLGDRYRVHTVDTLANVMGQGHIERWIGIVDVDSQVGVRDAVSRLELQYSACPLIVITARPEEWADSIARGSVLAAIDRDQLASARLPDALLAAENRLRANGEGAEARSTLRLQRPAERFAVSPPRRGALWAGAAVLSMGLATGGWLIYRHGPALRSGAAGAGASSPSAGVQASSDAVRPLPPPRRSVLELLSAARIAFRDQRLLPPPSAADARGDSALELYVQVLSQDPRDDEALAGVKRLLVIGGRRITTDADRGELEDANRLLRLFKAAGVNASDLRPLTGAVNAARPKWLARRAEQSIATGDFKAAEQQLAEAAAGGADADSIRALRSEEAAKKLKAQLNAMAARVNRAMHAGVLLPPAVDNALEDLAAMRAIARSHPLTLQTQYQVQSALVQAGEQATRTAQFSLAQRDLNAAGELGSFAPLSYARRQLQLAMAATAHSPAAAAHPRMVAARTSEVVSTPQAAPASARPYIAAQPTRALPLRYPEGASANGSVIVEFTLSAKGSASDVTVVQSDLPGLFEQAAISAVRRGRYSTHELVNGQPVRARIKLRFNTD